MLEPYQEGHAARPMVMRASSVFFVVAICCTSTLSMTLQARADARPPMTLLGGFLGAGKTTMYSKCGWGLSER